MTFAKPLLVSSLVLIASACATRYKKPLAEPVRFSGLMPATQIVLQLQPEGDRLESHRERQLRLERENILFLGLSACKCFVDLSPKQHHPLKIEIRYHEKNFRGAGASFWWWVNALSFFSVPLDYVYDIEWQANVYRYGELLKQYRSHNVVFDKRAIWIPRSSREREKLRGLLNQFLRNLQQDLDSLGIELMPEA